MMLSNQMLMRTSVKLALLASAILIGLQATTAMAQLSNFSDDFEDIVDSSDPNALHDGWLVGANVYNIDNGNYYKQGGFVYNYFAFPAPNGTGGFSNVTDPNTSDPPVGNRGVVVFSDYLNADHDPNGNNYRLESVFFREQTVGAADVGKTAKFEFVAQPDNL